MHKQDNKRKVHWEDRARAVCDLCLWLASYVLHFLGHQVLPRTDESHCCVFRNWMLRFFCRKKWTGRQQCMKYRIIQERWRSWGPRDGTTSSVRKEINFDSSAFNWKQLTRSWNWHVELTALSRWGLDTGTFVCHKRQMILFRFWEHQTPVFGHRVQRWQENIAVPYIHFSVEGF